MKEKGSYTIEAAILAPILVLMIYVVIGMCMHLYEEIQEYKVEENLEEYWGVEEFYRYQILKGVIDD